MRTEHFNQLTVFLRDIRRTPLMKADEELAAAKEVARTRRRWAAKMRATLTALGQANVAAGSRDLQVQFRAAVAAVGRDAEPLRQDLARSRGESENIARPVIG